MRGFCPAAEWLRDDCKCDGRQCTCGGARVFLIRPGEKPAGHGDSVVMVSGDEPDMEHYRGGN